MGVRLPSVATPPQPTITNIVTTAETIVLTSPPLNIPLDFSQILLFWWLTMTVGTTTTAVFVRIRRGNALTGTNLFQVATTSTAAGGNALSLSGCYGDIPGAVAGQQYVLTIQQTAATANGQLNDGALIAVVL